MKRNPIHRGSTEVRSSLSVAITAVASSSLRDVPLARWTASGSPFVPLATEPPRTTAVRAPDDTTIDEVIAEAPPAPVREAESDETVPLHLRGAMGPLVDAAGHVATPST